MGRLRQEDFDFLKADKPEPSRETRFDNGDEIVGTTIEGETVQGFVSAVGDTAYRLKVQNQTFTVDKATARTVYQEKEAASNE